MSWNTHWFFSFFSFAVFFAVFATHYAHVKSPVQSREIASQHRTAKPWYDASFKM
jgi:hypothetical protein